MRRPNLASRQFLDVRPVVVAGVALGVLGLVLTTVSLAEVFHARGQEKSYAANLQRLEAQRAELMAQVGQSNRQMADVAWKKLAIETAAMSGVVARRTLVWSQLLADLERVIPWDVRVISITPSIDKDGSVLINLTGVATGRDAWLKLLAVLFTDSKFSNPMPINEEAPSATNGIGYRFALSVHYWLEGRP
jgi:type IV pilus assembly protein PilN